MPTQVVNVMVVEDAPEYQGAVALALSLEPYLKSVHVAPSGEEALSNYLKMARRHCRRNHRSAHASCNTPR